MYFKIGPSKKQLYKIILLLLCLLFGVKSCKALTIQNAVGYRNGASYALSGGNGSYADIAIKYYGGNQLDSVEKLSFYIEPNTTEQQYKYMSGFIRFEDSTGVVPNVPIIQLAGNSCELEHSMSLGTSYVAFTCPMAGGWIDFLNLPVLLTSFYIQRNFGVSDMINNSTTLNQINTNVNNINDSINSDNVDNNQANSFFNDFSSNTPQGLVSLINKPLDFLNGLYNTCSPIFVYVPYFDFDLTLPCVSSIHNGIFDTIIPIAKIIINGLICYRLVLCFINVINKLKDPNDSDIEVVDL